MEPLNEWLKPEIIWFVIGLFLLILEFSSPGLIIAFFGIGAWVVAITSVFIDISLTSQLLIFLTSSIVLLAMLRKSLRRVFKLNINEDQNDEDDFIGQRAVVTQKITLSAPGKVEFKGADWEAEAETEIAKGTHVTIVGRESIRFKVEAL